MVWMNEWMNEWIVLFHKNKANKIKNKQSKLPLQGNGMAAIKKPAVCKNILFAFRDIFSLPQRHEKKKAVQQSWHVLK